MSLPHDLKSTTLRDLLEWGAKNLRELSPSPRLDSELLLSHATGLPRVTLIAYPDRHAAPDQCKYFILLIGRRLRHVPVAYLIGCKEFYGLDFEVTPDVLIPRPETELLVEKVLDFSKTIPHPLRLLDLGTGSGCIAITIVSELRKLQRRCQAVALDRSLSALAVAKKNCRHHGVEEDVVLLCADWMSAFGSAQFDVIVANPPYIPEGDVEVSPDTHHEPSSALYAGQTGLDDIRKILESLPTFLTRCGLFLCEIGAGQGRDVITLWKEAHPQLAGSEYSPRVEPDLSGRDRVLIISRAQ